MADINTRLCTQCKHCHSHPELIINNDRLTQYNCFHPNNIYEYSAIDGSPKFRSPLCIDLRNESMCTKDGLWWEIKPVNTTPVIGAKVKIPVGTNLLDLL